MRVQAAVFTGESDPLEIREIDIPEPNGNELLLKVGACGICGSDLHAVQTGFVPTGTVMGHEFAGEIVAVGADAAEQWQVGDRVIAAPILTCGECPACLSGDLISCANPVLLGLDDARYVLDRIAAGDIDTTGLVSATVSLDELPAIFSELLQPNTHCKVMVTP